MDRAQQDADGPGDQQGQASPPGAPTAPNCLPRTTSPGVRSVVARLVQVSCSRSPVIATAEETATASKPRTDNDAVAVRNARFASSNKSRRSRPATFPPRSDRPRRTGSSPAARRRTARRAGHPATSGRRRARCNAPSRSWERRRRRGAGPGLPATRCAPPPPRHDDWRRRVPGPEAAPTNLSAARHRASYCRAGAASRRSPASGEPRRPPDGMPPSPGTTSRTASRPGQAIHVDQETGKSRPG